MRSIDTLMAEGKAKPMRAPARRGRRRFAPVLSALLDDLVDRGLPGKAGAGDAQVLRLARAELRALLAVARAAYLQADGHHLTRPCSCAVCEAVVKLVEEVPDAF